MGKIRSELTPRWPNNVLTIDPGFGGTGWAFWTGGLYPITGCITEPRKMKSRTKEERLTLEFKQFKMLLSIYEPERVFIETMELWTGSLMSRTAASTGDLFFLQTLVGGFAAITLDDPRRSLQLSTPQRWKGQLSKDAIRARIRLIQTEHGEAGKYEDYPNHAEDAVGMGYYLAGVI
jgi:hypothetical protein